jgi:putative transposase
MARIARVVVEGLPHHVVQRGNRRQDVFFCDEDKRSYLKILKEQSERFGVKHWAYCLMSNHVHLIAVPESRESLARAMGEAHRRYTRMINFREGWRGYLWQGRFNSFPLDHRYVYPAIRYVEQNPVRARIVKRAEDYLWSSARAHILKLEDPLIEHCYLEDEIADWRQFLTSADKEDELQRLRRHGTTGRPLGGGEFIENLTRALGIELKPRKPGPKPRN